MITDVPVYFPFTFMEPERVAKLFSFMGQFKAYRVFERNVSDEISKLEADGKIICELFRLSSDKSVKIAHGFLDWSKNMESIDLKAVAAFFNHIDPLNESVDIMGSMDSIDKDPENHQSFDELLLRQEITLFLIQLLDRQEYDINSALRRISQNHKRLLIDPEKKNNDFEDNSSFDLSGFRLDNMKSRVVSWLAAFFFLSDQSRMIFTDEKDAFIAFSEFFKSDEIKFYKAKNGKDGFAKSDLLKLAWPVSENFKFDPDFFELLENGEQIVENPGDLFFAASDPSDFRKALAGALGLRFDAFTGCSLLSDNCIFPVVCFVA